MLEIDLLVEEKSELVAMGRGVPQSLTDDDGLWAFEETLIVW